MDKSYQILSEMLEGHCGQALVANRHWRIDMALKPIMREHGIGDLTALVNMLQTKRNAELEQQCVEAMINNETCFFRDQPNFALLTGPVFDHLREQRLATKRLRIWSAACSTGQEAYSLAIAINENPEKWREWQVNIIATDISKGALAQAKAGKYSQFEIQRGLPVTKMLKYFRQEGDEWIAKDELRRAITFSQHNMLDSARYLGGFDIVLCRNMLMYLNDEKRGLILDTLASVLAPDGMLMLGAAETVMGHSTRFAASREYRGFYELQRKASAIPSAYRAAG